MKLNDDTKERVESIKFKFFVLEDVYSNENMNYIFLFMIIIYNMHFGSSNI